MQQDEAVLKARASAIRMKDEAKDLGLDRVPKVRVLLVELACNPGNERVKAQLEEILRVYRPMKKVPFWPVPWPCDRLGKGEIELGAILHGRNGKYTISFNDLFQRIFITGIIGTGKTYLIYIMLDSLIPKLKELGALWQKCEDRFRQQAGAAPEDEKREIPKNR